MGEAAVIWGRLTEAFWLNCQLFGLTLLFALPLGLVVSFGSMSRLAPLRGAVKTFVWIIRGTPLMLQLMVVYFGPYYLFRIKVGSSYRLWATFIGFVINYAAYFAEIFRGGIQSIDRGQYEGAKVLGMTYVQTMRRIILPQVIKRVLPPVSNETINLLKDTSLVYILAMNDLMRVTRAFVQRDFDTTPFLVAAVFYLVCTAVLTRILAYVEKRYAVYEE